jgi:hypothetical protein
MRCIPIEDGSIAGTEPSVGPCQAYRPVPLFTTAREVGVTTNLCTGTPRHPEPDHDSSVVPRDVTTAHAVGFLDPRTRKLLSWSPLSASAQLSMRIAVHGHPPWTPIVGEFGGQLGGQPRGCRTGNLGGIPAGRQGHAGGGSPWPTPTAITPRCTGTSIPTSPRSCGMASSGRTRTPATTRAPPRRRQPCPQPGQGRRVLRIGPVIGRCVAVVPWHKLRRVRADLGSWLLRHGLGSRRAETTQSDYGRHLESVHMIVLFVPHAAGSPQHRR